MHEQILHTLVNNNREHVCFHEQHIEALAIPVALTSAKLRCKHFFACFILSNNHL